MTEPAGSLRAEIPSPARLRDMLQEMVEKDVLGPLGGDDEELDEQRVSDRYLVGVLAPANKLVEPAQQDVLADSEAEDPQDGEPDEPQYGTPSLFPSSFGLSFTVDGDADAITIEARWGKYERVKSETLETEKGNPKTVWKRRPMRGLLPRVPLKEGALGPLLVHEDEPRVLVRGVARPFRRDWLVTLFLVNAQHEPPEMKDEAWVFQAELEVRGPGGSTILVKRALTQELIGQDSAAHEEDRQLEMAYRDCVEFAVGHGVSVRADTSPDGDPTRAVRIATRAIPSFDVAQETSPTAEDPGFEGLAGLDLDMKLLAESEPGTILEKLQPLPDAYEAWIARKRASIGDPTAPPPPRALRQASDALKTSTGRAYRRSR